MAGLLEQLQKQKEDSSAMDDVLTTRVSESPIISNKEKEAVKSSESSNPEDLLKELISESKKDISEVKKEADETAKVTKEAAQAVIETSARIVRSPSAIRGEKGLIPEEKDDAVPWWIGEERITSPQIEALVPKARQMLNEILPADSEQEIDLSVAVRRATALAANVLRSEIRITERDQEQASEELYSLLSGKGPLQPLYEDPSVTDIYIDNHQNVRVIRRGQAMETPFRFRNKEEYKAFLNNMLQNVERVLNMSSPIVDCVLNDEYRSRINAVDSSVVDGDEPRVCIRVPRLQKIAFFDILQTKTLPATLAAWLSEIVVTGEANVLVLGPTGSGKTVMTTALLSSVNSNERIITIEDVPEIFVPTAHLEKLVSRPANAQGEGEIKLPELLRAALRRAPHRIVVGEIRDEEGRLFLRALETGHAGSIATIHAENSKDSLWRLLDVVQAYEQSPQESILRRIARSVHLTITMKKIDGRPCLMEVAEVLQPDSNDFKIKPLIKYDGLVKGKRHWRIVAEDSIWLDKLRKKGIDLRPGPKLLAFEKGDDND